MFLFFLLAGAVVLGWISVLSPTMELLSWTIHRGRYPARKRYWFECIVIIPPVIDMFSDIDGDGGWSAPFLSPEHRLPVMVLMACSLAAFLYSFYRKRLAPPLTEVLVNCFLLCGVLSSVAFTIKGGWISGVLCCLPFVVHSILMMADRHRMAVERLAGDDQETGNRWVRYCRKLILLPPWEKFPLLLLLCVPLLGVMTAVLLLFGQKPDSLIRAFTDTHGADYFRLYGRGPQPDYGAHYLCTIAAKGHPRLVRPIRMGERGGRPIKCNRQLLVSNAFEELLEQRVPGLHRRVRSLYNKIGAGIHRHYWVFDHAWVSDTIYVLMKPLEWGFVVVLYLCDRRPEDRIASQYLRKEDRVRLAMGRGGSGECDEVQGLA